MVGAMHHRGPDDCGVFADESVALGMTRLAIIDTSSGGHQPMPTPDSQITIVYNGELYNFRELRTLAGNPSLQLYLAELQMAQEEQRNAKAGAGAAELPQQGYLRNLLVFTIGSALVAALGIRAFMTGPH